MLPWVGLKPSLAPYCPQNKGVSPEASLLPLTLHPCPPSWNQDGSWHIHSHHLESLSHPDPLQSTVNLNSDVASSRKASPLQAPEGALAVALRQCCHRQLT